MSEPRLGKEGGIVPRSDFIDESRIAFGEPFAGTGDGIRVEIIECGVRDARSFLALPSGIKRGLDSQCFVVFAVRVARSGRVRLRA